MTKWQFYSNENDRNVTYYTYIIIHCIYIMQISMQIHFLFKSGSRNERQDQHQRRIQRYCKILEGDHLQNIMMHCNNNLLLLLSFMYFAVVLYTPINTAIRRSANYWKFHWDFDDNTLHCLTVLISKSATVAPISMFKEPKSSSK